MVGIVIVSHSKTLAEGVVELSRMMAKPNIVAAGGMEDGSLGTDYNKILEAIKQVNEGDGVLILMDMGSAVMTTDMVIEELNDIEILKADAPLVEGSVVASISACNGASLLEVKEACEKAKEERKFFD